MDMGQFLDTNIVFDALYPSRPLYKDFHKHLEYPFLLKMLNITFSTNTEVQLIATESAQFLTDALYNTIRPIDWDNLKAEEKEAVIKEIQENLESNPEVKHKNRVVFVLDALKEIKLQLQTASKSEIITKLCPHLGYIYTRELQGKIAIHFSIPPADGSKHNFNELITTIKATNILCKAFKQNENQDFDILTDMLMLISVGVRYTNNITQEFNTITFYSNDNNFRSNLDEFKRYVINKSEKNKYEGIIEDSAKKIDFVKPYQID